MKGPKRQSGYCIICGQPRLLYRRCEACRRYREHFGIERPERLWNPPPRPVTCWCGVPVYWTAPWKGLCPLHYKQRGRERARSAERGATDDG